MKAQALLLAASLTLGVTAAPYIVTSYVVLSTRTYSGYTYSGRTNTYTTYSGYTESETITTFATPVATPTNSFSALSTITDTTAYPDVTVLNVVLESGSRASIDNYASYTATSYAVPITYTPDATCSQNWTFTTTVPVYIPDIVSPTAVTLSTSTTIYSYLNARPSPYTAVVAVLNPTDISSDDLALASSSNVPYYMSYCYTPTTYCPTATGAQCTETWAYDTTSSNSGRFYGYDYADRSWYVPLILICVLVPVGWVLLWLIIGLLESWMSFKGLMLGQHRKRGLPYAWCCISVIFLCFTGPTYKAKSPEEQAVLLERWKELKKREKLKLWMKWGFRWKYPDMLGEEPELAKRAFRQGCL